MRISKAIGYSLSLLVVSISVWVMFNTQAVIDWWRLRDYTPAPEIAELSKDSFFSEEGERLFYIHDPELLTKEEFSGKCSDNQEETIILGCYISDDKIYVFDVEDERLEGVEEVTAAHEMLHVVYDRLDQKEASRLNLLLLDTFNSLNDERLNETIENYRLKDPSVVPNELHSIIATEVRQIPQELEEHYSNFFTDRLAVVSLAESYEENFTRLEDQIEEFDIQLEQLDSQIRELQQNVSFLRTSLETEQAQLERLRSNPEAFNQAVPSFNQKVRQFNSQLEQLRGLIDRYNTVVAERNQIALEEQELIDAIDTRAVEL